MNQVKANPLAGATHLDRITMGDTRWPAADGWRKMAQNVNGIEIHFNHNTITGAFDDFKFVR